MVELKLSDLSLEELSQLADRLGIDHCTFCKYTDDCHHGVTSDGNGNPCYPPCADNDPECYVDEDSLITAIEEALQIQLKEGKNNPEAEMLRIVICPVCHQPEYYGMIHWRSGSTCCRACIYSVWHEDNPHWHPGETDYIFPKYENGKDYTKEEQDGKDTSIPCS